MASLVTECPGCGNQSYVLIPDDIHIKQIVCSRCTPRTLCRIMEDKLPHPQHKIEYSYDIMLRMITCMLQKGVKSIALCKIAEQLWPDIDWHPKRYERNSIWGYKENETATRRVQEVVRRSNDDDQYPTGSEP